MSNLIEIEERESAFSNRLNTFRLKNLGHINVDNFFDDSFLYIEPMIESLLDIHYMLKVSTCLHAIFAKKVITDDEMSTVRQPMYIHSNSEIVDFETSLRPFYDEYVVNYIKNRISEIELRGSGWTLESIVEIEVQTSSYDPYNGASYISLPPKLANRKACINVQNDDNMCFKYAILSAVCPPANNPQIVTKYINSTDCQERLNLNDIKFPVGLKDLKKFEAQNPDISVNVYMWNEETEKVRPLRLTKNVKENHVHLMLLTQVDKNSDKPKTHYVYIKNLSALIGKQVSKNCRKKLFCDRCLNHFIFPEKLQEHKKACMNQNECQIIMPIPGVNDTVVFENYYKQMPVEFVVYADVESILRKTDDSDQTFGGKKTSAFQKHEVFSVGYYCAGSSAYTRPEYRSHTGPDCIEWFVNEMEDIALLASSVLEHNEPMDLSQEEEVLFIWSEECHICGKPFVDENDKVRDHCHITGAFRGAAHNSCNLNYQIAKYVTIIFHNLSNYDAHFIIKSIAQKINGETTIIPRNDEVYISFSKYVDSTRNPERRSSCIKLRFIDSFRFMARSLDFLSSKLPSDKKMILRSEFKDLNESHLKLIEKKGVFCYDYLDCYEKLSETSLPAKEHFYSQLNESDISDEDYEHAKTVWSTFNIKTLGEYANLYLKTDVLLLADVFENFRATCLRQFRLDPAHYFTAPGLSFDAMLKKTGVELELITDVDKLLFIERGIRGGISQCSERFAEANNKYMESYDPTRDSNYIVYLDANNLYGWSMMQHLPINEFAWCRKYFTVDDIMAIPDDSEIGYIFEVDLEYPQHLHDLHKDYPFCAENRTVPNTKNDKKLLLTVSDKKEYIIHYRMLKCALKNGLVLKKIHKVLQFRQEPWLKPYIDFNTLLRMEALNDFEKEFYKLMINAIFGKTMENMRCRVDIKMKTEWGGRYGLRSYIAKPNFKKYKIFDEKLVTVEMNRTHIKMEKPIAVGMSVLDISKTLMYEFFYDYLKNKYGDNVTLLYTDTDSFLLNIRTECFYSDMIRDIDKFDTSDYKCPNKYGVPQMNKKVPGKFKDEVQGEILTKYVGLRSKMYSCVTEKEEKFKKAKGVKKSTLKKKIKFKHFMKCIERKGFTVVEKQNTFRSKLHQVYTISQEKVALSGNDNKRYILDDNIHTLPWGHYKIPQ